MREPPQICESLPQSYSCFDVVLEHLLICSTPSFNSLEDLCEALKVDIRAASESAVPICTTVELSLSFSAVLTLQRPYTGAYAEGGENDLPPEFKTTSTREDGTIEHDRAPQALVNSIVNIEDPLKRKIVQRAASRGIIQAVERIDGFRYSFNNAWMPKNEEGARFSYICQDSMQNKDRHANGYPRTIRSLRAEGEIRGPRKPTYDCKGSVSVKFSQGRQSAEVYYRHYSIHGTAADNRAAPRAGPRPRPTPKNPGGLAATLQAQSYASAAMGIADSSLAANDFRSVDRPEPRTVNHTGSLKRKRDSDRGTWHGTTKELGRPLSLAELLRQSPSANPREPERSISSSDLDRDGPSVIYELPTWQRLPAGPKKPTSQPHPSTKKAPGPAPHLIPHGPLLYASPHQQAAQTRSDQGTVPNFQIQGLFTTMKPPGKADHQLYTPSSYAEAQKLAQARLKNQVGPRASQGPEEVQQTHVQPHQESAQSQTQLQQELQQSQREVAPHFSQQSGSWGKFSHNSTQNSEIGWQKQSTNASSIPANPYRTPSQDYGQIGTGTNSSQSRSSPWIASPIPTTGSRHAGGN